MFKPRVFISSTVYDFADLRSAIKYWLEEEGFEVSASEFNDFKKEVELNSYEACLRAIESCQYFILLIGTRAGGLMSSPSNTTITMAEYRHAYEKARRGELKIITLVRRSIWNAREDRQALGALIGSEYGLSEEDTNKIKHHSSKVVQDATLVFSFISEVCRQDEMRASIKGHQAGPINNWVHQFDNFREVVDVLRSTFVRNKGLQRAALLASLKTELAKNLTHLFRKLPTGELQAYYLDASEGRRHYNGVINGRSTFPRKALAALAFNIFSAVEAINSHALDQCLSSGFFLDYDPRSDRYVTGTVQSILLHLQESIRQIRYLGRTASKEGREILDLTRNTNLSNIEIDNIETASLVALHDFTRNTVEISLALLRFIETGQEDFPTVSPVRLFVESDSKSTPSAEDIIIYSNQDQRRSSI